MAPKGFRAAGIACGIKKDGSKDLALIVSEVPARVAGLFTQNRVKAAPVLYTRKRIRRGVARALLANSGCANACTGSRGIEDVRRSVEATSRTLGIPREDILVASTGVIGEPLPVERIEEALPRLSQLLSPQGFKDAASAIMTTDTVPKLAERTLMVRGKEISLLGMAKGAGMIRPRLATMLAFLFTDLEVPPPLLRELLLEGNSRSFARITVDGETSTNDTVLLFANGASGVSLREGIVPFRDLLFEVMEELALGIVRDAEGRTKVVRITVRGARTSRDASKIAFRIATSPLVKTALFGQDPNWGRVMAALGDAGVAVAPDLVQIRINDLPVVRGGMQDPEYDEEKVSDSLKEEEISLVVDLQLGEGSYWVWSTDLSYDYVRINASYRS